MDKQNKITTILSKLTFDINNRKKEYITLCVKADSNTSSTLREETFTEILEEFTQYLNKQEIQEIVNYLQNNQRIRYMDLLEKKFENENENCLFSDEFLVHLNKKFGKNSKSDYMIPKYNIISNLYELELKKKEPTFFHKNVGDVKYINNIEYEENFLIKIAKLIYEDLILLSENMVTINDLLIKNYSYFDFDKDTEYTIGELKNFLDNFNIFLNDPELKFLYLSFNLNKGRINFDDFKSFIFELSKRNYNQIRIIDDDMHSKKLLKLLSESDNKEERRLIEIFENNTFFWNIIDSLKIFGKKYLLKFFLAFTTKSKHLFDEDYNYLVECEMIELGYRKLGYPITLSKTMGEFKYYCFKRNFAEVVSQKIFINYEKIVNFLIDKYNLITYFNTSTQEVLEKMNKSFFAGAAHKIFESIFHSYNRFENTVDGEFSFMDFDQNQSEFDFRKNFNKKYGFVDSEFFSFLESEQKDNDRKRKLFEMAEINSRKWLEFGYNILFLGMIKNSDTLGIMFEKEDKLNLNNIYNKVYKKVFPNSNVGLDLDLSNISLSEINDDLNVNKEKFQINYFNKTFPNFRQSKPKENILFEDKNFYNQEEIKNVNEESFRKNETNNKSIFKETLENELANKIYTKSNNITKNLNANTHHLKQNSIAKPKVISNYNDNVIIDSAVITPRLYKVFSDYLKKRHNLNDINYFLISKLGSCLIIRDRLMEMLMSKKTNINSNGLPEEMHYQQFTEYLFGYLPLDIQEFIFFYSKSYLNDKYFINLINFFKALESIILEYSKIIDRNK